MKNVQTMQNMQNMQSMQSMQNIQNMPNMQNTQNMQNIPPLFFSSEGQKYKISESKSSINSRTCLGHLVLFPNYPPSPDLDKLYNFFPTSKFKI